MSNVIKYSKFHRYFHLNGLKFYVELWNEHSKLPLDQYNARRLGPELQCHLKDICGYFQCAPFPRLQTGKVVWVLSFDP